DLVDVIDGVDRQQVGHPRRLDRDHGHVVVVEQAERGRQTVGEVQPARVHGVPRPEVVGRVALVPHDPGTAHGPNVVHGAGAPQGGSSVAPGGYREVGTPPPSASG